MVSGWSIFQYSINNFYKLIDILKNSFKKVIIM